MSRCISSPKREDSSLLLLGTTGLPEQAVFPTCSLSSSELDRARPHSIAVRKMFQYGFQTYIPMVRETRTARDVGVFGAVGTAAILANRAMFAGKRVAAPICDGNVTQEQVASWFVLGVFGRVKLSRRPLESMPRAAYPSTSSNRGA